MSITSVRLKDDLNASLKALAEKKQRSKSWIISEALSEYVVKNQIEEQKWLDTLQGLESIKNGDVIDGDEIFTWMRSWGTDHELDPPKVKK